MDAGGIGPGDPADLDADPLAGLRQRFEIPDGVCYLDGNSLGALPVGVPGRVAQVVAREWGEHLIRAWNDDDWWTAPTRVGDRIGRLIGAAAGQVVVGESTSVQLFQALTAAARMRPGRPVLLSDAGHFPTDRYLAGSVARLLGLRLVEVPAVGLLAALAEHGPDVAAISYPVVDYRTGELHDVPAFTRAAHEQGALTVWDLSHAAGALPLELDRDGVDLAVGRSYKYLSGGPGAPAFLYVAAAHQPAFDQPLTGWHGHADPFAMSGTYVPAPGITRARVGTPQLLSLLALDAALDAFEGVDLDAVRARCLALGDRFLAGVASFADDVGLTVVTPTEHARRGGQLTLDHPQARSVMAALIERGVIGDVRPPSLLRFGINALYVSPADVDRAAQVLGLVLTSGEYRDPRFRPTGLVT
jgi:kynureninase